MLIWLTYNNIHSTMEDNLIDDAFFRKNNLHKLIKLSNIVERIIYKMEYGVKLSKKYEVSLNVLRSMGCIKEDSLHEIRNFYEGLDSIICGINDDHDILDKEPQLLEMILKLTRDFFNNRKTLLKMYKFESEEHEDDEEETVVILNEADADDDDYFDDKGFTISYQDDEDYLEYREEKDERIDGKDFFNFSKHNSWCLSDKEDIEKTIFDNKPILIPHNYYDPVVAMLHDTIHILSNIRF